MGLDREVVERARELLDREDRRLEALTRSLSELRQELEAERDQAQRMRAETEEVRSEYARRVEKLRGARENALTAIKSDLETAFRSAQAEIAAVVRDLQRGSGRRGEDANRARDRLERVRERTARAERRHAPPAPARTLDVDQLQAGTRVEIRGVRGEAIVVEPPDRRGRLEVRAGGARVAVPVERVLRALGPERPSPPAPTRYAVERAESESDTSAATVSCDLRGLRVDEALDRAEAHLNRALGSGSSRLIFIHGHGTGALRDAIRAWLRHATGVSGSEPAPQHEGGDGATIATLAH